MKSGLALLLVASLAASGGFTTMADAATSARRPAVRAPLPEWLARQREWDAKQRGRQAARWGGTLDAIVEASAQEAESESLYLDALATWAMSESLAVGVSTLPAAALRGPLRRGALDLVEHGRLDAAVRILEGPLREDRTMLPVRARAVGLHASPDSGLALLNWPPDRRSRGPRSLRWDALGRIRGDELDAALLAAAELADSAKEPRERRAALWRLSQEPRPAIKSYARVRLARSLASRGEPRLAGQILQQAYGISDDERVLLANLRADVAGALGDTVWGAMQMIDAAHDPTLSTSARYPIVKRAADWCRGARADSLDEARWLDLVRMLGDVGEGETALSLMKRRRAPPPDPGAAIARYEVEASILARLKRNQDAASAYGKLLRTLRIAGGIAREVRVGAGARAPGNRRVRGDGQGFPARRVT